MNRDEDLRRAKLLFEEYKIQNQVDALVKEYQLKPIKVVISGKLLRGFGKAMYGPREMRLNPNLINNSHLDDTVRHEFAHFLAYDKYGTRGHGYRWKMCAIEVGAVPEQYVDTTQEAAQTVVQKSAKYLYKCTEGCEFTAYRIWRRAKICNKHHLRLYLTDQLR